MIYYGSSNSSDGSTTINVTFDVARNQDLAAVDVQNAEKLAEPQLPDAVRTNGITILKANTDILAVVAELHRVPFEMGLPRVYTVLKLDERRDKEQTLEDKVRSVEERLKEE